MPTVTLRHPWHPLLPSCSWFIPVANCTPKKTQWLWLESSRVAANVPTSYTLPLYVHQGRNRWVALLLLRYQTESPGSLYKGWEEEDAHALAWVPWPYLIHMYWIFIWKRVQIMTVCYRPEFRLLTAEGMNKAKAELTVSVGRSALEQDTWKTEETLLYIALHLPDFEGYKLTFVLSRDHTLLFFPPSPSRHWLCAQQKRMV